MAPPIQALSSSSILQARHVVIVLAASMLLVVVMVGAAGPPSSSGSGYSFRLIRQRSASATLDYAAGGLYLMEYKLGESVVSGIMDTGSDLTWTNNSQLFDSAMSCRHCTATTTDNCQLVVESSCPCHPAVYCCRGDCMFKIAYAQGSAARGFMVRANLAFEETKGTIMMGSKFRGKSREIKMGSAVTFGCNSGPPRDKIENCQAYGSGGIVGLGRGKLSLVEQLNLRGFSYCLGRGSSSQIVFYLPDQPLPPPTKDRKSTPLVEVEGEFSHFYYVELQQISMGGKVLDIPKTTFKMDRNNGDRGMIIDSGTTYTKLPKEALHKVIEAVTHHMRKDPIPKDKSENAAAGFTCYEATELAANDRMPNMVLHFVGGDQMELPKGNYMIEDHKDKEVCLALREAHDKFPDKFILGNFQQKNIDMLFNLNDKELSFMPRKCSGGGDMHAAV